MLRSARTWGRPRVRCPRTFSNIATCGCKEAIASTTHGHRWRGSSTPKRAPAVLNGWHGYPPAMMSTGSTRDQSTRVMSPKFGTPGKRWARMSGALPISAPFLSRCSMSDTHAVRAPNTSSTARSRPPLIAREQRPDGHILGHSASPPWRRASPGKSPAGCIELAVTRDAHPVSDSLRQHVRQRDHLAPPVDRCRCACIRFDGG